MANLRTDPPPGSLVRIVIRWFDGPDYLTIHALEAEEEGQVPPGCLPIQGGGSPQTGVELISWKWADLGLKDYKFTDMVKPSFHYNEVSMNHTVTTRRGRNGIVTGAIRIQYSFLIPKYPIGTFSVYSCLGNMKFSARPVR